MVDDKLKELRGQTRRDFIRWAAVVGGALGLERSRLLNVLNDTGGSALADIAQCAQVAPSFNLIDGGGGLSNWTQIFPLEVQALSTDANVSYTAPGTATAAAGYDKAHPWWYGKNTPNQDGAWKWTGFLAGTNETHTGAPSSVLNLGANSMLASIAAIQQAAPTLLPVLTVGAVTFGAAPGAPGVASVNQAANLVDLFNSAASRALLQPAANGALADQYYKAFLGLQASNGRSSTKKGMDTGKVSMQLLAKNLASQLTPTTAEQALFGLDGQTPGTISQLINGSITAFKAMALGLTSMTVMKGFQDDPHGAFQNVAQLDMKASYMKKWIDGMYAFSKTLQDPTCASKSLSQKLVLTISGDTYKSPTNRQGWGDGTPGNSNILYVMGNGSLKPGWFGTVGMDGKAQGWDPATGNLTAGVYTNGAMLGQQAAACAAFAVAKDARRVADFINGGAPAGPTVANLTG